MHLAVIRHHRRSIRRAAPSAALLTALAAVAATAAPAADQPPEVVASFTQRVQPLVLNRCAAGACHGGERSPEPRFHRGPASKSPDQMQTRANLRTLLDVMGPERDPRPLAGMLAAGHPSNVSHPSRRAAALTTAERLTLERWLAEVREAEQRSAIVDPGVVPVSAEVVEPAQPPANRFREMLDAAANPLALPPPQEPRGLIFKNDVPPAE